MTNVILIIINIILSASIYLALTGCGFQPPEEQTVSKVSSEEKAKTKSESTSDDDGEVEEEVEVGFDFERTNIPGEYRTYCLIENGMYVSYELEITKNQTMYMAGYIYAPTDINCNFSAISTTYRKYSAKFLNKEEVNITVQEAMHTLYTQQEVNYANSKKLFGFSTWSLGVPKDIRGLRSISGASLEPEKGDTFYISYSFTDNDLFQLSYIIEDGIEADSPATRSTILDKRRFFKIAKAPLQ